MIKFIKKALAVFVCILFVFEQVGFAQNLRQLNLSGYTESLNSQYDYEKFHPLHLRMLSYDNALQRFSFLVDRGDHNNLVNEFFNRATERLFKFFLIGLTLPDESFWVNLRPDSADEIIDKNLAKTDMGRIFLEADLQLKKDTARFTSPLTKEGQLYWQKLQEKAKEIFGTFNISIPTLARPWIVPGEIILRETNSDIYIFKALLNVMLEEDHMSTSQKFSFKDERAKRLNEYASVLLNETVIPRLIKEVNTAKRYAMLRQAFYSLVMAKWFKERFKSSSGRYRKLINKNKLEGLVSKDKWSTESYFDAYRKSFQEGEYEIKVADKKRFNKVRVYFSGGILPMVSSMPAPGETIVDADTGASITSIVTEIPRDVDQDTNILLKEEQEEKPIGPDAIDEGRRYHSDEREKYERILKWTDTADFLRSIWNRALLVIDAKKDEALFSSDIKRLIDYLQTQNSLGQISNKGKAGDRVVVFQVPGIAREGFGIKDLNDKLGYELNTRLIGIRRQLLLGLMKAKGLIKDDGLIYSTYKEDVFLVGKDVVLDTVVLQEIQRELIKRIGEILRGQLEFRIVLKANGVKIQELNKPLYALSFGIGQIGGDSMQEKLLADISAHQAIVIGENISGANYNFSEADYSKVISEIDSLRSLLNEQSAIFDADEEGNLFLSQEVATSLRDNLDWQNLSSEAREQFINEENFNIAQRYFKLIKIQDYIKKWQIDFEEARDRSERITALSDRLNQKLNQTEEEYLMPIDEGLAGLIVQAKLFIETEAKLPEFDSEFAFYSRGPPMENPIFVTLDIKKMGIMNINANEIELQKISSAIQLGQIASLEDLWISAADTVTVSLIETMRIARETIIKELGISEDALTELMGGDEFTLVFEDNLFDNLEEVLYKVKAEVLKNAGIDIRICATRSFAEFKRGFEARNDKNFNNLAFAKAIVSLDDGVSQLKALEKQGIQDFVVIQDKDGNWPEQIEKPEAVVEQPEAKENILRVQGVGEKLLQGKHLQVWTALVGLHEILREEAGNSIADDSTLTETQSNSRIQEEYKKIDVIMRSVGFAGGFVRSLWYGGHLSDLDMILPADEYYRKRIKDYLEVQTGLAIDDVGHDRKLDNFISMGDFTINKAVIFYSVKNSAELVDPLNNALTALESKELTLTEFDDPKNMRRLIRAVRFLAITEGLTPDAKTDQVLRSTYDNFIQEARELVNKGLSGYSLYNAYNALYGYEEYKARLDEAIELATSLYGEEVRNKFDSLIKEYELDKFIDFMERAREYGEVVIRDSNKEIAEKQTLRQKANDLVEQADLPGEDDSFAWLATRYMPDIEQGIENVPQKEFLDNLRGTLDLIVKGSIVLTQEQLRSMIIDTLGVKDEDVILLSEEGGGKIAFLVNGFVIRGYNTLPILAMKNKTEGISEADSAALINNDKLVVRIKDIAGVPLDISERVLPLHEANTIAEKAQDEELIDLFEQAKDSNPLIADNTIEATDENMGLAVRRLEDGKLYVFVVAFDLDEIPGKLRVSKEKILSGVRSAQPLAISYERVAQSIPQIEELSEEFTLSFKSDISVEVDSSQDADYGYGERLIDDEIRAILEREKSVQEFMLKNHPEVIQDTINNLNFGFSLEDVERIVISYEASGSNKHVLKVNIFTVAGETKSFLIAKKVPVKEGRLFEEGEEAGQRALQKTGLVPKLGKVYYLKETESGFEYSDTLPEEGSFETRVVEEFIDGFTLAEVSFFNEQFLSTKKIGEAVANLLKTEKGSSEYSSNIERIRSLIQNKGFSKIQTSRLIELMETLLSVNDKYQILTQFNKDETLSSAFSVQASNIIFNIYAVLNNGIYLSEGICPHDVHWNNIMIEKGTGRFVVVDLGMTTVDSLSKFFLETLYYYGISQIHIKGILEESLSGLSIENTKVVLDNLRLFTDEKVVKNYLLQTLRDRIDTSRLNKLDAPAKRISKGVKEFLEKHNSDSSGPGGIDFRNISSLTLQGRSVSERFSKDPQDKFLMEMYSLINKKIIPSAESIKVHIDTNFDEDNLEDVLDKVFNLLVSILRLEEEKVVVTDIQTKELLKIVDSVHSVSELRNQLKNIEFSAKKPEI
ncbi:MAG: hypothetical protein P9L96_02135 [Candidatus Gygaella obscura]|nr:hypothetical protein [Candidatus Gygaella obscura]